MRASLLAAAALSALAIAGQTEAATYDVSPGALTIRGEIEAADVVSLPMVLEAEHKAGNTIRTAYLDSKGGHVAAAAFMAMALLQNDVATRVRKGATCASAYILAWAGGARRSFEIGARLGVHRSRTVDDKDDDARHGFRPAR